jgi:hypothetical protein
MNIEEWEKGRNIPELNAGDDRLKTFFLLDYVKATQKKLIEIWNTNNQYLQWKIFSKFDIYKFDDKLNDSGFLDDMVAIQLIDQEQLDPRLNDEEIVYVLNEKPDKKIYPQRKIAAAQWKELSIPNKCYYIPNTLPDQLNFLDYRCLADNGFKFNATNFASITDYLGLYSILIGNVDLWEYVDFEKDPWTVSFIPDEKAWLVLIQNTSNFVHQVAAIKNERANGWFSPSFHPWTEIITHLIDKNNFQLQNRYLQSQYYRDEQLRQVEKRQHAEVEKQREIKRLQDEEEERVTREQIENRERLKADLEKRRIALLYQMALAQGYERSEFGIATRFFSLPNNFTCDELKKAYRKKSISEHPDRGGSNERFQAVIHYYELLSHICRSS